MAKAVTSIVNETPCQLTLRGFDNDSIVLGPLEEKQIHDPAMFDFSEPSRKGLVRVIQAAPADLGETLFATLFACAIPFGLFVFTLHDKGPSSIATEVWAQWVWGISVAAVLVILAAVTVWKTRSFVLVTRFIAQTASLVIILAIGVGLPAAVIYSFGNGPALLADPARPLALFTRLIQLAFIAAASLLPVLLFFLFDRFRLGTLRKRLYVNLFRLDSSLNTVGDIHAKYGSHVDEIYGTDARGRGRLAPGSRWPVLMCAFVLTVGWIVALNPVGELTAARLLDTLVPQQSTFTFGFLGVYFFSLRLIAIRYARGDLKPKAYSSIVTRVFVVAVLSWVLDVFFSGPSSAKLVIAFLVGITPESFFTWLKLVSRGVVPVQILPQQNKLPLTDLEGIDLYDLGRLESEGIVNIEGLAHHELIDLIIDTRVPMPRLVDWIDQAILYLHLVGVAQGQAGSKLRDLGIRSATDLLDAWDEAERRKESFDAFRNVLGRNENNLSRLEVMRDALLDDEWLDLIINWRKNRKREMLDVEARPSTAESLTDYADKLLGEGRFNAAIQALVASLQKQETVTARVRLAGIFANAPVDYVDHAKARDNAVRALALAPRSHAVISKLVEIWIELRDYERAHAMLVRLKEIVAGLDKSSGRQSAESELTRLEKEVAALIDRTNEPSTARAAA